MRGLEIKNLRAFNLALLGKWKWKFKNERTGLRFKALLNIYGEGEYKGNKERIFCLVAIHLDIFCIGIGI